MRFNCYLIDRISILGGERYPEFVFYLIPRELDSKLFSKSVENVAEELVKFVERISGKKYKFKGWWIENDRGAMCLTIELSMEEHKDETSREL